MHVKKKKKKNSSMMRFSKYKFKKILLYSVKLLKNKQLYHSQPILSFFFLCICVCERENSFNNLLKKTHTQARLQ